MTSQHFLRNPLTSSQDLSSEALSYTTSINRDFKLEEICIKFSIAITEIITITRNSKQGTNYDIVIDKKVLSGDTYYVFKPQGECNFIAGDEVKVECTNANGIGVVYLEIRVS